MGQPLCLQDMTSVHKLNNPSNLNELIPVYYNATLQLQAIPKNEN